MTRATALALLVGTLALGPGPGCMFVSREAGERMEHDLQVLRGDVQRLHAGQQEQADALRATDGQLAGLQKRLEKSSQSNNTQAADMGSQLDKLQELMQQLRGALEESDHRLTETQGQLEQKVGLELASLKEANAQKERDARARAAKKALPTGKKELLALGKKRLTEGRADEGRAILRDLCQRFAKERGIGDEALWLLATDAYRQDNLQGALRDFVRYLDLFPTGARNDEAYFRVAECSQKLGRTEDAQTFYGEVIRSAPRSVWAKQARAKLGALTPAAGAPAAPPKAGAATMAPPPTKAADPAPAGPVPAKKAKAP